MSTAMTQELQSVIKLLLKLSADEQRRYALQIEEQLKSDLKWDELFEKTTDEQWDKMIAEVEAEIESGDTQPLEDFLNSQWNQASPDHSEDASKDSLRKFNAKL